jgi:hypothetical protein
MTDDTHPISDAELDAVLGEAFGRLDEALNRAMNTEYVQRSGPIRIDRAARKQQIRPAAELFRRSTEPRDTPRLTAINVLIVAIQAGINSLSKSDTNASTWARLSGIGQDLEKLGRELNNRAIARDQAQAVVDAALAAVNESLAELHVRPRHHAESDDYTPPRLLSDDLLADLRLDDHQEDPVFVCQQLMTELLHLADEVERLFDDADDWSTASVQLR